jgi:hypothetical protein
MMKIRSSLTRLRPFTEYHGHKNDGITIEEEYEMDESFALDTSGVSSRNYLIINQFNPLLG